MTESIWEVRLIEMKKFEGDEVPTSEKIREFRQISEERAEEIRNGGVIRIVQS